MTSTSEGLSSLWRGNYASMQEHIREIQRLVKTSTFTFIPTGADLSLLDAMEDNIRTISENSVCQLRYYKNQLKWINRFPDEILTEIFLYSGEGPARGRKNMLQYLYLTWVSRRWRQIILNRGIFWNRINLNSTTKVDMKEIIKRSKNARLDLHWLIPRFRDGWGCTKEHHDKELDRRRDLFLSYIAHAASIHLIGPRDDLVKLFDRLPDTLELQAVVIKFTGQSEEHITAYFGDTANRRPILEFLVKSASSSWDQITGHFKDLRILRMHLPSRESSSNGDLLLAKFLDIIRVSPLLQELNLTLLCEASKNIALEPVSLENLHYLDLTGAGAMTVLSYISVAIAKLEVVSFDIRNLSMMDRSYHDLFSGFIDFSTLKVLDIKDSFSNTDFLSRTRECMISGSSRRALQQQDVKPSSRPLKFEIKGYCGDWWDYTFEEFAGPCIASCVALSQLDISVGLQGDIVIKKTKGLPIRRLVVRDGSSMTGFFRCLQEIDTFTLLEEISFYRSDCTTKRGSAAHIVACVKARKHGATPLKRIKLVGCPKVPEKHAKSLEKFGVELVELECI
ncbi:hypothetical protein M422DRAFT_29250 [Sphaerobolus stellatus SS14]|nr:hypothetical protein M422DRAFT_29250 [Sphaerobolus stellatus SS14]